jgi:actin-related protein 6
MVPEALFNPADIGMEEAGLAETVAAAVKACHPQLHGLLYSNVLITGGTAQCPGFKERLETELRALVPDDYALNVTLIDEPHLAAWRGGAVLGSTAAEYQHLAVTRAEWQQHGAAAAVKWEA